jgi:hydroxymethylpyrimidine/phosphomethylpyrimidine kinase
MSNSNTNKAIKIVLTIAGSDSGGGAGIQADLKTFAALGVYGTSAVTAVTAQNTLGVFGIQDMSPDFVGAQIDATISDIGADAVKVGMLANADIIELVANKLNEYKIKSVVVDPVMVAKGGDKLLRDDAVDSLRKMLIPLCTVLTPNIAEASVLVGHEVKNVEDAKLAARAIVDMGARAVVVKGGHLEGDAIDVLFDGKSFSELSVARVQTRNTHGTGCTFSSAIAAGLAKGLGVEESVVMAKNYVTRAIEGSLNIGGGHGPLNHFVSLTGWVK